MTQHVMITGAASGLGLQTAVRFAEHSANVTLVDFDGARLESAAERIRLVSAGQVRTIEADLRESDGPESAVHRAWLNAPVDILVNCAGIYPSTPFLELTPAIWDGVQDVNVRAPMLTTVALARLAIDADRRASVVNISSTVSMRTRPGASAYSTSKAAVEMLTRSAALELGPHGIRVNAIAPGFIQVESSANPVTEEYTQAVSSNPLGVSGTPDDVARAILWISGPEAAWITGSVLRVDGGSSTGSLATPLSWDTTLLAAPIE